MPDVAPHLAYHCPRLRSEHLKNPCALNLKRLEALQDKFPGAFLGPLEHCSACQGKDLMVKDITQIEEPMEIVQDITPEPKTIPVKGQFCKNHPGVEAKKDKHGTFMGVCHECMAERMRNTTRTRNLKVAASPFNPVSPEDIVLAFETRHADLRKWLVAQAEYNERTLSMQIIYLLKRAMQVGVE